MIVCRSGAELERMREAGRLVGEVLTELAAHVAPGVSTGDLDALAETRILKAGATPAFKGYHGYPAAICASINDEVIHGIPSGRRLLREGDIVSIDVGASLELFAQYRWRAIPATVAHEQHLIVHIKAVESRIQTPEEQRQRLFFVIDRNNDGENWRGHDGDIEFVRMLPDALCTRRLDAAASCGNIMQPHDARYERATMKTPRMIIAIPASRSGVTASPNKYDAASALTT